MAAKMTGSPFHIETPRYKYANEKSEVPVAPSEFNKTITHCAHCLFWAEESRGQYVCLNEKIKEVGSKHCSGFKDDRNVMNAPAIRHDLLVKRVKDKSKNRINTLVEQISKYKLGTNSFVDQLFGKKWALCGSNPDIDKQALGQVITALKGENYTHKKLIQADYVIRLNTGKMSMIKLLKKEIERVSLANTAQPTHVPQIITYQDFCKHFEMLENILSSINQR